jgi:type I restriction enzyme S subunit
MIGDLKQYAEYKDSGLPWLGQVPKHWSVQRTKWQFGHRKELNADGNHTNVLSLTLRGVVNNNPYDPEGLVPKDYRTYQFFAKGDLVFKLIDLENLRTSRVGLVHEDGIMSSAYVRLVPTSSTNMRYFFHQFYDLYARGIYNQLGAGVRSTLSASELLNVGIATPPPGEQAAIVRFLDWANGRLERAVKAKRKVAALLNEQKQAIIHRAVTRGLNPSVSLKPSGIPWLGDIPKHWEVRKVGTVADLIVSNVDKLSEASESAVRLCNYVDVYKNDKITKTLNFMHATATQDEIARFKIQIGDVIITKDSEEWDDIGVPSLVTYQADDLVCGYHLAILRPQSDLILGEFLHRVLEDRLVSTQMHVRAKGVTRYGLSQTAIRAVLLPLPPVMEQEQIALQLNSEIERFGAARSRLEDEIDLLREYRTRLAADVVTGKIDVREAAARLPEEVPLDTVEDDADLGEDLDIAHEEATA